MNKFFFFSAFWICGYGFAFGGDYPFIGNENLFVLYNADEFPYSHYFVHSLVASLPSRLYFTTFNPFFS